MPLRGSGRIDIGFTESFVIIVFYLDRDLFVGYSFSRKAEYIQKEVYVL